MEVHGQALSFFIDDDVRRSDMWGSQLRDGIVQKGVQVEMLFFGCLSDGFNGPWRHFGGFGWEIGFGEVQAAWRVDLPWAAELVRIGESDITPLMIGEVEVVASKRRFDPVRNPNKGGTLDIFTDTRVGARADDGSVDQSCDFQRSQSSLNRQRLQAYDSGESIGIWGKRISVAHAEVSVEVQFSHSGDRLPDLFFGLCHALSRDQAGRDTSLS